MSQLSLLKNRRFFPLLATLFLGAFNDNLLKNALVFLVTYQSIQVFGLPPSEVIILAGMLFVLPYFLFSAFAGQVADKFEKSRLIRIIKALEVLMMAIAGLAFLSEKIEWLLLVIFLMGLQSTFFAPIKFSVLPQHLKETELVGGNALVSTGTFFAILIGTVSGVLIRLSEWGSIFVSLILFLFSALGLFASFWIPKAPATDSKLKISWEPFTPSWQMFQFSRQNKSVFWSILGNSWFWFLGSSILVLLPTYAKEMLKVNEITLTFFLFVFTVGIAVGALLCERLSRKRLEIGLVPFGSFGMFLFLFDLFLIGAPSYEGMVDEAVGPIQFLSSYEGIRISVSLFGLAVFSGFYIVPLQTLLQQRSEPSHRSRILAANNIMNALFMVAASFALIGLKRLGLEIPDIMLVLAMGTAAVSLVIFNLVPEFLFRFLLWLISSLLYRVRVKGYENLPEQGPAVLVCNHVSFVDWMLIGGAIKRPIRFVMTYKFHRGFFLKRILRRGKAIPIASKRDRPEIYEAAFSRIADELGSGELVCIFPEGKLTPHGEVNEFRPGIEKIIQTSPVPVIPMALKGLWGSFFSLEGAKPLLKWPKKLGALIELEVGQPIEPERVRAEELERQVVEMRGSWK
ncbi:MAG: MFS transporter [Bradymonadales bacterium]|nr:MAG: MFS transporter [Bradymonadales bacterium]